MFTGPGRMADGLKDDSLGHVVPKKAGLDGQTDGRMDGMARKVGWKGGPII